MIFKNDPKKENDFLKRYIKRLIKLYLFAFIFSIIFCIIILYCKNELNISLCWALFFYFLISILIYVIVLFKGYKRAKKTFSNFSLEITDDEIIINSNSNEKRTKFSDIKQIAKIKDSVFLVSTGSLNSSFYIHTENVENSEELSSLLNQIMERLSKEQVPNEKENIRKLLFRKKLILALVVLSFLGFLFRYLPMVSDFARFLLTLPFVIVMIFMAILLSRSINSSRKERIYLPILIIVMGIIFLAEDFFKLF